MVWARIEPSRKKSETNEIFVNGNCIYVIVFCVFFGESAIKRYERCALADINITCVKSKYDQLIKNQNARATTAIAEELRERERERNTLMHKTYYN